MTLSILSPHRYMLRIARFKSLLPLPLCFAAIAMADEPEQVSPLVESEVAEKVKVTATPSSSVVGTKSFDADTVNELFAEYKAENERRVEEMAPHMNSDSLDIIELGPVNVQAYEVRNLDALIDRLDPQPRRKLARLAELDPVAAANIQVTARSEERFFGGENDMTDMNSGTTANIDFRKVGQTLAGAVGKAKKAMREKKATDDQAALPTGE